MSQPAATTATGNMGSSPGISQRACCWSARQAGIRGGLMDLPLRRRRAPLAFLGLAGLAAYALSFAPADAQQVIAGKGSVTIDLGVLNQLGPPVAGGYAPSGQASSYPAAGSGQPVYGQ